MKRLSKKDWAVLAAAMAMTMPAIAVFNGNPQTWYINVIAIVYCLWVTRKLTNTKIGRAFCMRLAKIENKIFAAA